MQLLCYVAQQQQQLPLLVTADYAADVRVKKTRKSSTVYSFLYYYDYYINYNIAITVVARVIVHAAHPKNVEKGVN